MLKQQIVFPNPNHAELTETELPALGPLEWVLKAETSLVSTGTELIIFNGEFEPGSHWDRWVEWPFKYAGYNLIGRVEAVGADVTEVQVGERFASRSPHASRHVFSGGATDQLVRVPEDVTSEDAAWFGMACIAQIGFRCAKPEFGDAIVIIGAGILGQLLTQYARLCGARDILVIDTSSVRLAMAKNHGADRIFEGTAAEAREAVSAATRGRGADVVFDVTGHPSAFSAGLGLVRNFGTFLLLGDAPKPGEQRLTSDVITRGVRIVGAHNNFPSMEGSGFEFWSHGAMTDLFFTYVQRGQMNVSDLMTHRFDFREATGAYPTLLRDRSRAMGVVFDWTPAL